MHAKSSKDFIIVTGGDQTYFPLIAELLNSIRRFRDARRAPVGIIDAGLERDQAEILSRRYGCKVHDPGWEYALPKLKLKDRIFLKANISKAFLDRYFPEFGHIVWIDADAWVQDWAAVELMVEGAMRGKLAVVSQASRYNAVSLNVRWSLLGYAKVRSILYKNARRAGLRPELQKAIGNRPTLNSGVYALPTAAPHWRAWRDRQEQVLKKGRIFTSDQLSLALMAYIDGYPYECLPEWCNYMGPWLTDDAGTTLVEAYLPNRPIGIVHLAGEDELRRSVDATKAIPTLGGGSIRRSLRYPAWARDAAG